MTRWRVTDAATGHVRELEADDPKPSRQGVVVDPIAGGVEVVVDGWRFEYRVEDAARADLRARASTRSAAATHGGPTEVRAIIPGRVVAVSVVPGDQVTSGTRLLSVEAMKMENEVRAPRDGTVTKVVAAAGDTVELGDVLVVLR